MKNVKVIISQTLSASAEVVVPDDYTEKDLYEAASIQCIIPSDRIDWNEDEFVVLEVDDI